MFGVKLVVLLLLIAFNNKSGFFGGTGGLAPGIFDVKSGSNAGDDSDVDNGFSVGGLMGDLAIDGDDYGITVL